MKKYLDTVEEMIRICVRRKTVIYGILITGAVLCILKLAALDSFIIPTRFNAYGLIQRIHGIQKHEAYSVNNYNIVEIVDTFSRNHQLMPGQEEKKYDILINSYMRSGSSFTGQLLAFDPDIFYWYEPLWNYNSGVYYWGKKYVCTGRTVCGLARDKYSLNVERMQVALKHIYNCSFSTLAPAVAEKMTPFYSGKIWTAYLECRKRGCSVECCLLELEVVCKKAKHRATKVVRMTVDNLEYVLDNTPDLKVIHLIRDPRAIINSRITTTWYQLQETPVDNHQRIKLDATDTCLRIMYDLKAAEQLKVKYPTRFAIVMFEDLQNDLITKSKILYSYFGIDSTRLETKLSNMTGILAHEHTVQMKWGDYTNWWRFQLSFSAIKVIDSVCRNVTQHLGYKIFDNENDLKNISINAFSFSSELLLENMFKSQLYDFHLNDLH